ncbi:hypothetical protein V6N13_049160 [Hibiscus sabdariffa]
MADSSVLGWILCSAFTLVALCGVVSKIRKRKGISVTRTESLNSVLTSHGECGSTDGSHHADVIIVGAGVAGSALAYTLGKDGRRVHVIERDLSEPDRIVGELLQPGGYLKLLELGLEDCVEEIDAQQRMREKSASLHNVHLEQGTVTSLLEEKGMIRGVQYKTKDGCELTAFAPLTIVCDGCFSNLRRSLCNPKVDVPSYFVGLVLENCHLPYSNHGHVILADPSPILFYPISSTEVRCLVDVPGPRVPSIANGEMANYLKTIVAPQVPPEIYDSFVAAVDKGNIRTMPNRSMPAAPLPTPGALLMGDAFNMRHPLTGGGMTVALSDIVVLRNLLRPISDLHDAPILCKYLESFYTLRKPVASTINTLAVAIYGVGRLLLPFPSPKRIWIGARLISGASGIIFPIIKAEGVRQMFFPATVPAYYRAPPLVEERI